MSDIVDRRGLDVVCGLLYAATILLLVWTRIHGPEPVLAAGLLLTSAIATLLVRILRARRRPAGDGASKAARGERVLIIAAALVGLISAAALMADHRLDRIASDWEELVARHEARRVVDLDRRLTRVIERSERAAERAARAAATHPAENRDALFGELERIRSTYRVEALAVIDDAGELNGWAGDHRGPLPIEAKRAGRGIIYAERPLFGYLYVSVPVEGRGEHAVAAVLMQTGLALETGTLTGFAEEFAHRSGVRPYFGPGAARDADWSLIVDGQTLAHATFEPPSQAEWRAEVEAAARRVIVPLGLLTVLVLGIAWLRRWRASRRAAVLPLAGLGVALLASPLGGVLGPERVFSPTLFLLPAPGEISLGRLLSVLVPLAALAAAARPIVLEDDALRRARVGGPLAVALGFAGALELLTRGAAPSLLEGGPYLWAGLFPAALLLLTVFAALALPNARPGPIRIVPIAAGIATSLVLAAVVVARWRITRVIDPWMPALWALPFALVATGVIVYSGRFGRLIRWLLAGWIAASAVVPFLWVHEVQAKLLAAEREIAALGDNPDPFLDYGLRQFAAEAQRRHARGEDGVELLYRSWVTSGMAREAYPARITLQTGDRARVALDVGELMTVRTDVAPPAELLARVVERARTSRRPVLEPAPRVHGASQVLAVPLTADEAITVAVRPRRSLAQPTVLAPLIGAEARPNTEFSLVPATPGHPVVHSEIEWVATDDGWRSETLLRYPDGEFHAHFDLRVPPGGVLLARAALLLAAGLALLAALWAFGRVARGEPPGPDEGWGAWSRSFRARVTIALFAFFLLPTVLFGMLAFRALAGEADRTARVVAERAATQAVTAFGERAGDLRAVADRIEEGVLYYHRGELADASSPEVFELGLLGAWMPASVYGALQSGEEVSVVETRKLGERPYLVAYRRLPAGTLAVPVSLASGEAATRQRELADLVLFAALIGGLLSLALSVAVGRALARPIGLLRRASAAVGSGSLDVRLPETDAGEFGEVFESFNQMTRRLGQARAKEAHTARVLAWGEMSRQVAHEIKNPLTPIKLSVQHLRRAFGDQRPDFDRILDTNVDQILEEIDRLTEIARAFSRYGAPDEAVGPLQAVDVSLAVHEALTLYRAGEAGVEFWPEIEAGLPSVLARPGEMKEVLLNLLENAYTALEDGGTVLVSARQDGEFVDLAVRDDGPGVPPELLERVFEPHFSTRSAGTGLGLAIVRRIIESWGGSVSAESEAGQGTTIRMRLPIADSPDAEEDHVAAGTSHVVGRASDESGS